MGGGVVERNSGPGRLRCFGGSRSAAALPLLPSNFWSSPDYWIASLRVMLAAAADAAGGTGPWRHIDIEGALAAGSRSLRGTALFCHERYSLLVPESRAIVDVGNPFLYRYSW